MIRGICIEDAESIRRICEQSLGHETTKQLICQRIKELSDNSNYYIIVYEDDSSHHVLGFLQAEKYHLLYGDNGWNIIALAVSHDAQKQGIGKQLLLSLEEYAECIGYSFVRLNCNVIRDDAHAFYLSQGYTCDKTQKRFIKHIACRTNSSLTSK